MTRLTPAQRAWLVLFCVPVAFLAAFSVAGTCIAAAVTGGQIRRQGDVGPVLPGAVVKTHLGSVSAGFIAWWRGSRERFRHQRDCSHHRMEPYGEPCPDCGTDPLSDKF